MFIAKKHIPRRTFLRCASASLSLPLLEAMVPAATALTGTAANGGPRMGFFYFPHGAVMANWTPDAAGREFELKSLLQPLAPHQRQLTIVSNLENKRAYGPVHAITPGTWLTGEAPRASHEPSGGVSIDQLAAQRLGQDTPLPSIEVATEASGAGCWDRAYGSGYSRTISFRAPSVPLPMESNPRKLFQTLLGIGDSAAARKASAHPAKQSGSILDLMRDEAGQLAKRLGAADRRVLSDYLETVRGLERRVQKIAEHELPFPTRPDAPQAIAASFDDHINLQMDLILLAFQGNITRVASMMMAAEGSQQAYRHLGLADAFHTLSHHQNDPGKIAQLLTIQEYHSRVFARFVDKLAALPDGDRGSMLDNAILLYGSNMSNSNAHDHYPLPSLIVGRGGGVIRGGQHIVAPERTPASNLMLTILDRIGIQRESLGDSTGRFSEV